MSDIAHHIQYIRLAELQFRLASAVRNATACKSQPLDLPDVWSHGKHTVEYAEIALTQADADVAVWGLHRSATFLMAVAMKDAIVEAVHDPKTSTNSDVQSAYQISRIIRNAFAHAPFDPVWSIDADCRDKVFAVQDIITLNTAGLQGQRFDWRHYGGPLALLRLSQFVRAEILGDVRIFPNRPNDPASERVATF